MCRFYRVENDVHCGPFNTGKPDIPSVGDYINSMNLEFETAVEIGSKHFCPIDDCTFYYRLHNYKEYVFGFSNFDQVFEYFSSNYEMEYFRKYGFRLSIYEVPEILSGTHQAVAHSKNMTLVESMEF